MKEKKGKGNSSVVVRIVIWSIVAFTLISILAVCMVLPKIIDGSLIVGNISGFGFNSYYYDDSSEYNVGGCVLTDEEINSIDISWVSGSVKIIPGDTDEIVLSEKVPDKTPESRLLRWRLEDGKLTVKYKESSIFGPSVETSKSLTLIVPSKMLSSLDNFKLQLVSAEASATGVGSSTALIGTVSGDASFDKFSANDLDVDSVSGDINIRGNIRNVNADTVSGNIKLEGEFDKVDVSGTSSAVEVTYLNISPAELDVDMVSGDINIRIPEQLSGFEVEFDSVSGDFTSDFSTSVDKGEYRFGDGSFEINADTVSGDLKISKN